LEAQVKSLVDFSQHQSSRIVELETTLAARDTEIGSLNEKLEEAEAEIRRLKQLPAKPKLRASKLDEAEGSSDQPEADASKKRRAGSDKVKKKANLEIHAEQVVHAEGVPEGWRLKGYEPYVVQELRIEAHNIRYDREVWVNPDGPGRLVASLPAHLQGQHFGATLRAYILHQYYHSGVSQGLLRESLADYGVSISTGQINHFLTEAHEGFHTEKASLLEEALALKQELRTDDTGARHQFKAGFCNCLNSDLFTYFTTTDSKSRINFLKILRRAHTDYHLNEAALAYVSAQNLPPKYFNPLLDSLAQGECTWSDEIALEGYFDAHGWQARYARRILTEALLIGSLIHHGFDPQTLIHSDGAGQFDLFVHSLCWKHAERPLLKLRCYNEQQEEHLQAKQKDFWRLYQALKQYKANPQAHQATELTQRFEDLCQAVPDYQSLNQVLEELKHKQPDLLRVLEHPEASLQNNASERDIREYVKRRKISAGTRSELGKQARDTFLSLKKTCRKLDVSFWQYLLDRITQAQQVQPLSHLMRQKAQMACQ
jgi:uncharacterized coiled-coil protein SlyX